MKYLLLVICTLLVGGCSFPNKIVISELAVNGEYAPFYGKGNGCEVALKGSMENMVITYNGTTCTVSYGAKE